MSIVQAKKLDLNELDTYIRLVTPEEAQGYLNANFALNRTLDKAVVDQYIRDIKNNEFTLSTDFIGFDVDGALINGQHRLSAVVAANKPCYFGIVAGLPTENAQNLDKGKKRDRSNRLAFDGKPITKPQVSLVQQMLVNYNSNASASIQFRGTQHDDRIWNAYTKHKSVIDLFTDKVSLSPLCVAAAAIKMCVHMSQKYEEIPEPSVRYPHEQDPVERALHFFNLAKLGYNQLSDTRVKYDASALELNRKLNSSDWKLNSNSCQKYRIACSHAYVFMTGKCTRSLTEPFADDPFGHFVLDTVSTN